MSIEANKNIVRRYQEIYNNNDLDHLTEVVSEDLLTPMIMPGIPPGIYIVRIADGKIVEHWGEEDSVSLLQQLGVLKM